MPEGPEVLRCGQQLSFYLKGNTVKNARAVSGKLLRLGVTGLADLLFPDMVSNVYVKGKVIIVSFASGRSIVSTLGMSGWWYSSRMLTDNVDQMVYVSGQGMRRADQIISTGLKHARFVLTLDDGSEVAYCDQRNFGNLYVTDQSGVQTKLDSIGVDLLAIDVDVEVAANALNPKSEIGAALLEQGRVAGLGNIYRAETLYFAGISPHRKVSELLPSDLLRTMKIARAVLHNSCATHGLMHYSLQEFLPLVGAELQGVLEQIVLPPGMSLDDGSLKGHMIYGQQRDRFGHATRADTIGGRTMWWTPQLQK